MHRGRRLLGMIWASPNTLLGLCVGFANPALPRFEAGCINFYLQAGVSFMILSRMRISAITIGDCVLYMVPPTRNLRVHEGRHIAQYHALGPLFLPCYFLLLAYFGYEEHPLETDARQHEFAVCGSLGPSGLRECGEPE